MSDENPMSGLVKIGHDKQAIRQWKSREPSSLAAPLGSAHREYLAFLFYAMDSKLNGNIPCRWGTLRDDLKEKWLAEADAKTNLWLDDEEAARKHREDDHNPRAFFC